MSYYNRIGFISKVNYNKIKRLTPEELCIFFNEDINDGHVNISPLITELHNLGKYVEYDLSLGLMFNFFTKRITREFMGDDEELYRVDKEFLEFVIEDYRSKIKKNYDEMGTPFRDSEFLRSANYDINLGQDDLVDDYSFDFSKLTQKETNALYKILMHIRTTHFEWRLGAPYNIEEGEEITKSNKYEYAIFELIRIYKTFNWKKNILVYYGG